MTLLEVASVSVQSGVQWAPKWGPLPLTLQNITWSLACLLACLFERECVLRVLQHTPKFSLVPCCKQPQDAGAHGCMPTHTHIPCTKLCFMPTCQSHDHVGAPLALQLPHPRFGTVEGVCAGDIIHNDSCSCSPARQTSSVQGTLSAGTGAHQSIFMQQPEQAAPGKRSSCNSVQDRGTQWQDHTQGT